MACAVNRIVENQQGSRLSEASPIYKKIEAKLRKQGLDCTMGDSIRVTTAADDLLFGSEADGYRVTGAGEAAVNGLYLPDATKDAVAAHKR